MDIAASCRSSMMGVTSFAFTAPHHSEDGKHTVKAVLPLLESSAFNNTRTWHKGARELASGSEHVRHHRMLGQSSPNAFGDSTIQLHESFSGFFCAWQRRTSSF
eukprot:6466458-Amphidinium_carterae.1